MLTLLFDKENPLLNANITEQFGAILYGKCRFSLKVI